MSRFAFLGFAALALPLSAQVQQSVPQIEFNRDVRPILSDSCFTCHGQDEGSRKGGLRLDDRASALTGGKTGLPAIVPGKPDESELLLRIMAPHDSEDLMPTAESKKAPLTAPQVATLRQWIAEGAEYQAHWGFIPPARPALPAGANDKNPLDAFVSVRRSAAGLKAAPEAAPETLARRLWLDLVGLPPSPRELDEFIAAYAKDRDKAYAALVETLLASPRYGEKWARHWLDAARYADSDGYEKDLPREQWAWRDWVIKSINADQPYDQFIIDQIAGDLLAPAERDFQRAQDLRVATGYLRNAMVNQEGAIINEQYRIEGMFDRMDAIGKGVLGVTLQCAQCHTHKFDPITHVDYFQVFAALNNTYEATMRVYGPEKLATLERVHRDLAAEDAKLKAAQPDWAQLLSAWAETQSTTLAATPWETLTPVEPVWGGGLAHPTVLPDGSVLTLGTRVSDGDLSFTTTPKMTAGITALRLEALTDGDLIFGGPGRSPDGLFAVSELEVEVLGADYVKPASEKVTETHVKKLELAQASADFEAPSRLIDKNVRRNDDDKRVFGPSAYLVDGKLETAWSPDRGVGRRNAPSEVVVRFKAPLTLAPGEQLWLRLRFKHSGKDGQGRDTQLLGRFRAPPFPPRHAWPSPCPRRRGRPGSKRRFSRRGGRATPVLPKRTRRSPSFGRNTRWRTPPCSFSVNAVPMRRAPPSCLIGVSGTTPRGSSRRARSISCTRGVRSRLRNPPVSLWPAGWWTAVHRRRRASRSTACGRRSLAPASSRPPRISGCAPRRPRCPRCWTGSRWNSWTAAGARSS